MATDKRLREVEDHNPGFAAVCKANGVLVSYLIDSYDAQKPKIRGLTAFLQQHYPLVYVAYKARLRIIGREW